MVSRHIFVLSVLFISSSLSTPWREQRTKSIGEYFYGDGEDYSDLENLAERRGRPESSDKVNIHIEDEEYDAREYNDYEAYDDDETKAADDDKDSDFVPYHRKLDAFDDVAELTDDYYYDDDESNVSPGILKADDSENDINKDEKEIGDNWVYPGCGKKVVKTTEGLLRIIGGGKAQKGSWPWQVAVLDKSKDPLCGGTLIAPQWVLTAAHCLDERIYVRLGEHDFSVEDKEEIEMKVEPIRHPNYNEDTLEHDIALLKLPREVKYNRYIIPACLPDSKTPLPTNSKCIATGWGKERYDRDFGTEVLKYVRVPIVAQQACKNSYPEHEVTDDQFCAGNEMGSADTCAGDSGGPLVCDDKGTWTLYGVTSSGEGCGKPGKFGVYMKVSNYMQWIRGIMAEN